MIGGVVVELLPPDAIRAFDAMRELRPGAHLGAHNLAWGHHVYIDDLRPAFNASTRLRRRAPGVAPR
jgi:hypothetical protein